jgi:hypothetical protein
MKQCVLYFKYNTREVLYFYAHIILFSRIGPNLSLSSSRIGRWGHIIATSRQLYLDEHTLEWKVQRIKIDKERKRDGI